MTCKTQYNRNTLLKSIYPSTNLVTAIPLRSALTDVHNTIAQHQQRREKVTLGDFSYSARANRAWFHAKAATPAPVAHANQLFSATEPPFTRKRHCFVRILTFQSHPWCSSSNAICQQWSAKHNQTRKMLLKNKYSSSSLGAAIPLRSALAILQIRKELQHSTVEHVPVMHQFQCTKYLNQHMQTTIAQRQQRREQVT